MGKFGTDLTPESIDEPSDILVDFLIYERIAETKLLPRVDIFMIAERCYFFMILGTRENFGFYSHARISELIRQEKPIQHGIRQRIRPYSVIWVHRCDHEKWIIQRERSIRYGHLLFLHAFQQGGLYFRWSAVDFVSQYERTENRSFPEDEFLFFGIVNFGSENVRRKQIRSKLDTFERNSERLGREVRGLGLGHPGRSDEEKMPAGEKSEQVYFQELLLSVDMFGERSLESGDEM